MKRAAAALAWTACALTACGSGATADPGLGSRMRVEGAQFVPGPLPSVSPAGPHVASVELPTNTIWPGLSDKAFEGSLDPRSTAAVVALGGDDGYWIIPAGVPDFATPTLPTFKGTASFATTLSPGRYTFQANAVDAQGVFGPPAAVILTATDGSPASATPAGALVVTLTWDTESDLDLHVVDPLGDEIYHGDPSSMPAFSGDQASDAGGYGYLDFDSNADCVIDGLRREDVIWPIAPPSGTYLVRVDTASLCGEVIAHFQVRAWLDGVVVGSASGVSLDSDTWGPHDRGAGELVLSFAVP